MTPHLLRRAHAAQRAEQERDALLQVIRDADLDVAVRHALEHRTHALYDEVHMVVTMGDETVFPTVMTKVEKP